MEIIIYTLLALIIYDIIKIVIKALLRDEKEEPKRATFIEKLREKQGYVPEDRLDTDNPPNNK